MADTPERLAERLRIEGQKTSDFFSALGPLALERVVYTEGVHWSVRHILAHFVASEISLRKLVSNISQGGPGSPEDFDLNGYNERKVSQLLDVPAKELISQFSSQREATADLVAQLAPNDLSRTGRHPYLGIAPLEDIIKIIYRHNQIHQREIRKFLELDEV